MHMLEQVKEEELTEKRLAMRKPVGVEWGVRGFAPAVAKEEDSLLSYLFVQNSSMFAGVKY